MEANKMSDFVFCFSGC